MTVKRFQRPVAQLLQADFVRRHLGGSSGGERGFDLVGRRLRNSMATEPDCDFAGAALQGVITVNGLSIPMTDSKQCVSSCSVAEID